METYREKQRAEGILPQDPRRRLIVRLGQSQTFRSQLLSRALLLIRHGSLGHSRFKQPA